MKTTVHANDILKLEFQAVTIANMADNAAASPATAVEISLHTADTGAAGSQSTNVAAYPNYAHASVTRSPFSWTVANRQASNIAEVTWPKCGAATSVLYTHVGASLGGTLRRRGILGSALGPFVAESTTATITNKAHGLVVGQRVAFYATPFSTLPTGLTEGSLYYVRTVPDADSFTLALTSSGSTLDLQTDGDGVVFLSAPIDVFSGVTPKAAANQIVFVES